MIILFRRQIYKRNHQFKNCNTAFRLTFDKSSSLQTGIWCEIVWICLPSQKLNPCLLYIYYIYNLNGLKQDCLMWKLTMVCNGLQGHRFEGEITISDACCTCSVAWSRLADALTVAALFLSSGSRLVFCCYDDASMGDGGLCEFVMIGFALVVCD